MPLGVGLPDNVTTVSSLIPAKFLPKSTIEDIIATTQSVLVEEAMKGFPTGTRITIRDLLPADLGLTNQEWTETSSTDNSYTNTSIAAKSIADETYVAIYGMGMHDDAVVTATLVDLVPVTVWRFTVGATKVAQWALMPLYNAKRWEDNGTSGVAGVIYEHQFGIAQTPIIIGKNGVITIEQYSVEASIVYKPFVLGFVCEKQTKTLNP